jgi:hypothetical protein
LECRGRNFYVHCHEFGARGGDDTIEEKLGGGKADRLGADLAGVVNKVTTYGEADMMGLFFLGSSEMTRCRYVALQPEGMAVMG